MFDQTCTFLLMTIGFIVWLFLTIFYLFEMKKAYVSKENISKKASISIWFMELVHTMLVAGSSFFGFWLIQIDTKISILLGMILIIIGLILMLGGMKEFGSIKKLSGLDNSKLVTTGIYKYSRNPQYLGWFITLFGISFLGHSILSFLLTFLFIVIIHFRIIKLEEPYLSRIFGNEYELYKKSTSRYFSISKKQDYC